MKHEEKLREISSRYGLDGGDFWVLKRGGKNIPLIAKSGIEKIIKGEEFTYQLFPVTATPEYGATKCMVFNKDGECVAESLGSAYSGNCKTDYFLEMSEKRAKGRCVLLAIDAHGDLYSEDEFADGKDE